MRGRFSVMPPPVMCAMPLIRSASSSGRTAGRYDRCGRQEHVAHRAAQLGDIGVRVEARTTRRTPGAPANTRWCAGRTTADRAARRPAAIDLPSISFGRSTDADDEAGDVVFAVGVEARHLGGLPADAARSRSRGRPGPCPAQSARQRPATAGRSRGSREKTAASRPAPGCR